MRRGSRDCAVIFELWAAGGTSPRAAICASIFFVTSGKGGRAVRGRELDPVVLGGIMGRGKVQRSVCARSNDSVGNGWGWNAASAMTSGVMPWPRECRRPCEQKVSPRKRGSRPTMTFAPEGFSDTTYRAIPVTARRTFAKVNSSATIALHPDVPNLI